MKKIYLLGLSLFLMTGLFAQNTVVVDFEEPAYTIADELEFLAWTPDNATITVAEDPVDATNQALKAEIGNYNTAPVVKITLADGMKLSDYIEFKFDALWLQGDVGWKNIVVTVGKEAPGLVAGIEADEDEGIEEVPGVSNPFAHGDGTYVEIGSINRAQGANPEWEKVIIDITNELDWEGEVYFAFGMNQSGGTEAEPTTWYADNITISDVETVEEEEEEPTVVLTIDFEEDAYTIGDELEFLAWTPDNATITIAEDPKDETNQVLKAEIGNYNTAPVIKVTLADGMKLSDYLEFKFDALWLQGDVGWKNIVVTVGKEAPGLVAGIEADEDEGIEEVPGVSNPFAQYPPEQLQLVKWFEVI